MEAGRRAVRTSPAPPQRSGRAGRQRDCGSEQSGRRSPPSSVRSRTGTARCRTHHHSPPTCAGHRSSSSNSPRREDTGGSIVTALRPAGAGEGRGCGANQCAQGPGLQGECGSGGGDREAMAPVAARGPIPGWKGAAEAESGRGSQRLCLLRPSSLRRRNQSRGRRWEGSGARAGAGGREAVGVAVATVRRRDSREVALRPGAAGAERRGGRERGSGAGPESARGGRSRLPRPLTSPLAEWEPLAAARSRGQGGRGSRVEQGAGGKEEELRNGGRAGRETFDRFVDCKERKLPKNEGVWRGGGRAVRRAMLEWGPGEEVRLGLWVLRGGVSVELEGRTGGLRRGSPLTRPRLRVSRPSLSLSLKREEALGLHSCSPGTPPLLARVQGRGVRRGD